MKKYLLVILFLSIATHFAFFGHPDETVFDEVHFGKFVSGYYTGEYYFDIHPPLGKLMIAGFGKLFDFKPEFSFAQIGDQFPDKKYMALRFLPSLAGTLLPIVIFLLALQLKFSSRAAFVAGLLVALENALLVQTRYILMDGFLLLFGFLSLLFYFKSRSTLYVTRYKILMAVFGGFAISIKWTGLTFLALPFFIELFQTWKQKELKRVLKFPLYFLVIPSIIYFSVFVLHFSLLTKPGPGDAFMSPSFRSENIVKKFVELNVQMYQSNQRLTATHPYSSQWYIWPFMTRPIFYWVKGNARIYFFGNPAVWWASTAAVLLLLWQTLKRIANSTFRKRFTLPWPRLGLAEGGYDSRLMVLLGGYILNLLPFIGIKRVMFLYHYLTALIFAILILCYLIDQNPLDMLGARKNAKRNFGILLGAVVIVFLFFAPLSYGLKLTPKAYEARTWFASWR